MNTIKKDKFIPGQTRVLYGGVLFGDEERKAIDSVLDRNWWGISEEAKRFEEEAAEVIQVKRSVFLNSGSSALEAGIRAMKLPKGSEVIVPACTFPTPISSLIREGLIPVVADIDLGSYFLSPDSVKESISDNTKAILMVYVAGTVGWLGEILDIAAKNKLRIIEDNCDGLGGTWMGKSLGSMGEFSAVSTHAAHIISSGEGGMVMTDNEELANVVTSIRDWGRPVDFENRSDLGEFPPEYRRYIYTELGSNLKPLELQAAMGRIQLRRLAEFKEKRVRNFNILKEKLSILGDKIIMPWAHPQADPCWYTFPITLNGISRTKVLGRLDKANIEWRPILAGNIAKQPAYKNNVIVRSKLVNADRLITDSFWVSVHPRHSEEVMNYVADEIIKAVK